MIDANPGFSAPGTEDRGVLMSEKWSWSCKVWSEYEEHMSPIFLMLDIIPVSLSNFIVRSALHRRAAAVSLSHSLRNSNFLTTFGAYHILRRILSCSRYEAQ